MNLRNRLSIAISEGISKALDGDDIFDTDEPLHDIADDEQQDTSVYINHSKWHSMLQRFIDERLDSFRKTRFQEVLTPSDKQLFDYLYANKGKLDDMTQMLCNKHHIYDLIEPESPLEMFALLQIFGNFNWLNTVRKYDRRIRLNVCYMKIAVITTDGREIPIQHYDRNSNDAKFLLFENYDLCKNGTKNAIIIDCSRRLDNNRYVWQYVSPNTSKQVSKYAINKTDDAKCHFDGYGDTMEIIKHVQSHEMWKKYAETYKPDRYSPEPKDIRCASDYIPAIMKAYDSTVDFMGNRLHGYLPSIGQLHILNLHADFINKALEIIGAEKIDMHEEHWSSTEYISKSRDEIGVWAHAANNTIEPMGKKAKMEVLPLYPLHEIMMILTDKYIKK